MKSLLRRLPFARVSPKTVESPWAPLSIPVFRAFWIASLLSNLGTWVHETGASWLMTQLDSSPVMVSAVRTAMSAPLLLLALPAGVLADRMDRRTLLLITQSWMLVIAILLATLTRLETMTPSLLLALTSAMGLGMVLHVPTWQAAIPELVSRQQLTSAVALGSVSFNLARSSGPALGGLLIAWTGEWSAFAVNAGSFAGVIGVLVCWKRAETESSQGRSFLHSMGDGISLVVGDVTIRHVLMRVFMFVIPASAFWALLPLVAKEILGWQALGYGMLVCGMGIGAVLAASWLPIARAYLGIAGTLTLGHVLAAVGLITIAANPGGAASWMMTIVAGSGWMICLTTLNSSAQLSLPKTFRARGMSCYLMSMAASMSLGSLLWGRVADYWNVETTIGCAGLALLVTSVIGLLCVIRVDHSPR